MRKTLEQYLRDEFAKGAIDHSIRVTATDDGVRFYIHASGKDSDTQNYIVGGNLIVQDVSVRFPGEPGYGEPGK